MIKGIVMTMVSFFLLGSATSSAFDKLAPEYWITYGDPNSSVHITEYFSFSCPNCAHLFDRDFRDIHSRYVDTGKVFWTFQPVPMDLPTVQAMVCLEQLGEEEKRIFLEEILAEASDDTLISTEVLMTKIMEVFGKPVSSLGNMEYLENTKAFTEAFNFVKQGVDLEGVPTIEINGSICFGEVPSLDFVSSCLSPIEREVQR